jgi:ABC-type multidrug transport system fused ATPase/permease subunit
MNKKQDINSDNLKPYRSEENASTRNDTALDKLKKKQRRKEIKSRIRAELYKEKGSLFFGSVAMVCSAASNQAVPKLLGRILDNNASLSSNVTSNCPATPINSSLLLIVLGGGFSSFLRTMTFHKIQNSIASRIRSQLFTYLLHQDLSYFQRKSSYSDKTNDESNEISANETAKNDTNNTTIQSTNPHSPTAIIEILSQDVNTVAEIPSNIGSIIRSTLSLSFTTYNLININASLLKFSMSIIPIIGSTAVVLNKYVKKIVKQQMENNTISQSFAQERLEHLHMVKISNRENDEVETFSNLMDIQTSLGSRSSLVKGLFMGFMFVVSSSALVTIFHIGGSDVAKGKMTHGELKSFATYTFLLGLGTSGLLKDLSSLTKSMLSAERVYGLMMGDDNNDDVNKSTSQDDVSRESKGDRNVVPEQRLSSEDIQGVQTIKISNVNFSYESNSYNILHDICFDITRGQVVALVGKNGSGKSTLASLLVSLYTPQSGSITAVTNNHESIHLSSLDRKAQSQLVQMVPQQPVLFEMSIWDNITYANPTVDKDDVQKILNATHCNAFISKLPDGLEYNVGRNGSKLSGGQRQRLALARALLCNPALLILDEPNTSLDAEGDLAVSDAVQACRQNKDSTTKKGLLLITHRAKTLELADLIVVMKDGVIVEKGSYHQLSGNKDSELCRLMPDLQ